MRRFDKLKVIKEANQKLEKNFLSTKSIILEETPNNKINIIKEEDTPPTEAFNMFKKELSLKGGTATEASGTIPAGNGKSITINAENKYFIYDVNGEEKQKGEYKVMGIWPAKHIELKPEGGENFLKLKNILSDLDKKASSSSPTSFFNNFKTLVKNPKNLTMEDGYYSYEFYTNKKTNISTSIHIIIDDTNNGETGTFKMSWKNKTTGDSGAPTKWTGTFKKFGEIFISDGSGKVGSIDTNGKIDSGLILILSEFWPKYSS